MSIEEHRRRIDALDHQLVRLLNERAERARRIGEFKQEADASAYAPDREREVLDRVTAANGGPLAAGALHAIFREVISACRALERSLTVACWGPPASNTHLAACQRFGSQATFLLSPTLPGVFEQVDRGQADFGVIPVENSTEGVVAHTLDQFLSCDLRICSEIFVPIHHNLLSNAASTADIRRVFTMPQATAQCRAWLAAELPHAELVDTTTTARAAELAAADPEAGAIASTAAAEHYGLRVLAAQIEDNPRNRTRFWVIGRLQPAPTGRDKTSVLFSVPHRPGELVRALAAFAEHGVSLTFIESRPTRQTPWEYVFFVDVQGHVAAGPESGVAPALAELEERCAFVRVLGSYPEAENA